MKFSVRALKLSLQLVGSLPLWFRIFLGRAGGYLFSIVPTKERRIAHAQMRLFLGKSSARMIANVYAGLGQTLTESLNLAPFLKNPDRYLRCKNLDVLLEAARRGAVLCLSAHTGNWDLLAAYVIAKGGPVITFGQHANKPTLNEALHEIRSSYGARTIWRSDTQGFSQILGVFKQRDILAVLVDQDTDVHSTIVPFFGQPCKTPSALISLAKRYKVKIFSIFIFRTGFCQYQIFLNEINERGSVEEILGDYNSRLEGYIRQYPEQWVWFHKRWRTPEQGQTMSSAKYIQFLDAKLKERETHRPDPLGATLG